jgi:uncharacterized protein (TIGR00290 family)
MSEAILFSWSSGKDSALALHTLMKDPHWQVTALLTTVTEDYDRISMHGVRRALLEAQAAAIGLPLEMVYIPKDASNETYEDRMGQALRGYQERGVWGVAFGDIFLEDLRRYREENLARMNLGAIFPLWKRPTGELAHEMIRSGFRAVTTCVDTRVLGPEFVGRKFDVEFLSCLPAAVDPCGENGEFHTFVYDGPLFSRPIDICPGEKVLRSQRFYFCDLTISSKNG